jgi:hypothetical protein
MAISIPNNIVVQGYSNAQYTTKTVRRKSITSNTLVYASSFDATIAVSGIGYYRYDVRLQFLANKDDITLEVPAPNPATLFPITDESFGFAKKSASFPDFVSTDQVVFVNHRKGGSDIIKSAHLLFRGSNEFLQWIRSTDYTSNWAAGDTLIFSVPKYLAGRSSGIDPAAGDYFCIFHAVPATGGGVG